MSRSKNNSNFSLMGQNWKFVNIGNASKPLKNPKNQSVLKEIEKLEEKSMNERLCDVHETNLNIYLQKTRTNRNQSAMFDENDFKPSYLANKDISTVKEEADMISTYDAKELAISMNTIRMFYAQKGNSMDLASKPNVVIDRVTDSPKKTVLTSHAEEKRELIYQNGQLMEDCKPAISLAHLINIRGSMNMRGSIGGTSTPPTSPGKNSRKTKGRISYNFTNGDYNIVGVETVAHSPALAKAMMRSRAGISKNLAEKTRLKLAAAQEQVSHIEISKHFRKYAVDKGYRLPLCLNNVPAPKPTIPHQSHSARYATNTSTVISRLSSLDDGHLRNDSHRPSTTSSIALSSDHIPVLPGGTNRHPHHLGNSQNSSHNGSFNGSFNNSFNNSRAHSPIETSSAPSTTRHHHELPYQSFSRVGSAGGVGVSSLGPLPPGTPVNRSRGVTPRSNHVK